MSSSSIVGQWWFGRDTRFVPHCEKRHLPKNEAAAYQTPTQRHHAELAEVRRQLQRANTTANDKEKHLNQLRERLSELELIIDTNSSLMENHRLHVRLKEVEDEKHAVRL
jgi:chromosome segregation ATPase